jgi:hypothetical protein
MTTETQAAPLAPSPAAPAPHTPALALRVPFSVIALFGYVAFLLAGFGTHLGPWRPIPLYIFFGFLVFLLQMNLLPARSLAWTAYTVVASLFTLLFAADLIFNTSKMWHFTKAPLTYIIINALLFVVPIVDAVRRRPELASGGEVSRRWAQALSRRWAQALSPATLATDCAELAILAYIAATLVNLLHAGTPPYLTIDLNQALHLHLPARLRYLQDFDTLIALLATALALLFVGMLAGISTSQGLDAGQRSRSRIAAFEALLGRIMRATFREVLESLRLVLGPLVFVSTGISIAFLSIQIVHFFNIAQHSTNVSDLLNPFGPASKGQYEHGLQTLLLIGAAVATFIVSIAIVDHDMAVIRRTFHLIGTAGQTLALSLAFFLFSLAFLNSVLVILGVTAIEPFQVSVFGLLALLIGGLFALPAALRGGQTHAAG